MAAKKIQTEWLTQHSPRGPWDVWYNLPIHEWWDVFVYGKCVIYRYIISIPTMSHFPLDAGKFSVGVRTINWKPLSSWDAELHIQHYSLDPCDWYMVPVTYDANQSNQPFMWVNIYSMHASYEFLWYPWWDVQDSKMWDVWPQRLQQRR